MVSSNQVLFLFFCKRAETYPVWLLIQFRLRTFVTVLSSDCDYRVIPPFPRRLFHPWHHKSTLSQTITRTHCLKDSCGSLLVSVVNVFKFLDPQNSSFGTYLVNFTYPTSIQHFKRTDIYNTVQSKPLKESFIKIYNCIRPFIRHYSKE